MSRLSSEKVCAQHNQIQANVISVDSRTSVVALAGRREITLVNLEQPTHVLKTIQRHSKYEVSASEFHPKRSVCYALASNQSLEVYELDHELTTSTSMLNYNMRPFTNSIGFRGLFDYSQPDGPISTDNRGPTIVIKQGHTR